MKLDSLLCSRKGYKWTLSEIMWFSFFIVIIYLSFRENKLLEFQHDIECFVKLMIYTAAMAETEGIS